MVGLQRTFNDDSLKVYRGTNKEVKTLITQKKIMSLVSSVFDPIELFVQFIDHMRQLLKGVWTKKGQFWDHEMEPGEEEVFLR